MVHRGPDAQGLVIAGNVGLGHRRLSIIDLSGGHQPMSNAEGTLWVTFNGEIYNFRELRALLESKGYVFRTKSDTEVILHAYAEFGEQCIEHLRGMFAFGLWDQTRRQLLLARDRLGIKPLYYTLSNGTFLFASEIKALLQWKGVLREMDTTAFGGYLRFRYVPGPRTMFRGIFKLQPGCILIFREGNLSVRPYWDLPTDGAAPVADPERQFSDRLQETVRLHLISEVPLGVFLSGGIDSSTVVAMMAPIVDEAIQTFSVGYPSNSGQESDLTEFVFARMVAERFKTIHCELEVDPKMFWRVLPQLVWHFDEPVADPAAVPLYFLSKYTREFVTVALSGEGSDELLAGYSVYQKMLAIEWLRRIPGVALSARLGQLAKGRKLRRYADWLKKPLRRRYRGVSTLFAEREAESLLIPELRSSAHWDGVEETYFDRCAHLDALSQMLYFDLKVWLPDDLLVKADKMTMAASLELRVPFLDHELVEWTWRLPSHLKLRQGIGKYLLRRAVGNLIPSAILARSKLGFPVPIRSWFRGRLAQSTRELLFDEAGPYQDLFEMPQLDALIRRHEQGDEDFSGELYALIMFALWHRLFIGSPSVTMSPPALARAGEGYA